MHRYTVISLTNTHRGGQASKHSHIHTHRGLMLLVKIEGGMEIVKIVR